MIPGRRRYRRRDFRRGITCGVVGCTRRARHQWAYPCAVTTMASDPLPPAWLAVCDDCDIELNRALLRVVGVPDHALATLLVAYRLVQADRAYA